MSRSARPARIVAAASVMAGALLLAACSPTTTTLPYAPSDGARVNLTPQVRGINLLVVSPAEGGPGAVLGALANDSAEEVSFVLAIEGTEPLSVDVPAGQTIYLNAPGQDNDQDVDAFIDPVVAPPGGDLESTLSGAGEDQDFDLPVLDGTLPEYEPYVLELEGI